MYIRTAFVQILDNYLLADLNRYMDFVCIQTLASCLIALIYYLTIFFVFSIYYSTSLIYYSISMLNSAYSAFSSSLAAIYGCLTMPLYVLKIFWASSAFALVGWLTPSDGLISLIDGSALFLASLTSLWWVG